MHKDEHRENRRWMGDQRAEVKGFIWETSVRASLFSPRNSSWTEPEEMEGEKTCRGNFRTSHSYGEQAGVKTES